MGKRPNETAEERVIRKARKKSKKEKKAKKEKENNKKEEKVVGEIITDDEEQCCCWNSFEDAPFDPAIQTALKESAGFTKPSPIQSRAWPVVLAGKDLIAVAKTGSGKTLGFLLPLFHRISTKNFPDGVTTTSSSSSSVLCLVLSPTRELAIQIQGECVKFGSTIGIRSECVYGGTNAGVQIQQLKQNMPQVVIATPGRLCDLLERKSLSLTKCHFVVLDEADRMLDMGFEPQLKQIMGVLPDKSLRQTLFFTATWPKAVRKVASKFLRDNETTEIFLGEGTASGELVANKAVTQTFIEAQDDEKDKKLYDLLVALDEKSSVVIFANTKRRVDFVSSYLWREGFSSCAVHGDKQQRERDAAMQKFAKKEYNILVATDVAARGLDIKGVTHVINFDMARDVDSYVHRIGRTGRAGEVGDSITFWNPDYDKACSPALVKIARNAGQKVPAFLEKYEKGKASKQWKVADAEKAAVLL